MNTTATDDIGQTDLQLFLAWQVRQYEDSELSTALHPILSMRIPWFINLGF